MAASMEGWLEKKGTGMFARWQKRYWRLDVWSLQYFESETDMDTKDILDLKRTQGCGFGDPNRQMAAPEGPATYNGLCVGGGGGECARV